MQLRLTLLAASTFLLALPAAAQSAADGQRVFAQCRACHTVDQGGRNGVGPNLHGMFGRQAGSVSGFRYSAPMKARGEAGLTWTDETLSAYLRNPRAYIPGGSMAFAGLRNDQQVADLIAYLRQATGAAR
jgi:cytochrome c